MEAIILIVGIVIIVQIIERLFTILFKSIVQDIEYFRRKYK